MTTRPSLLIVGMTVVCFASLSGCGAKQAGAPVAARLNTEDQVRLIEQNPQLNEQQKQFYIAKAKAGR